MILQLQTIIFWLKKEKKVFLNIAMPKIISISTTAEKKLG